jgi:hypothetical protein
MGAVERAFANLEWKAATVLAGSVIEALLLWVLDIRLSDKISQSVSTLVNTKVFLSKPRGTPDDWGLFEYVEIAADLKVIQEDTAKQVRLAKDYRNLIHPARVKRKGQTCNRSTAMTAIAALDRVTEDLSNRLN